MRIKLIITQFHTQTSVIYFYLQGKKNVDLCRDESNVLRTHRVKNGMLKQYREQFTTALIASPSIVCNILYVTAHHCVHRPFSHSPAARRPRRQPAQYSVGG